MPSIDHEAPLLILREEPALVPMLVRECLGIELPAFDEVEVGDPTLTQAQPVELRSDLVVHLRAGGPDRPIVMGIIVEVQRTRDDDKRYTWPLYTAALRARLRCPTCLVVLATDDTVARWAATAILDLQPDSVFVPLVLGPAQIPRISIDRARREPWLAVLSALTHGHGADATDAVRSVVAAIRALPEASAEVCYDLLRAILRDPARSILENAMHFENYQWRNDSTRKAFGDGEAKGRQEGLQEGRQEGLREGARKVVASLAGRYGAVPAELLARLGGCDVDQLHGLAAEIVAAADREAIEQVLARLSASS